MHPLKTISITAYNRPDYLEQVLRSLIKNNLQGWHIYIALEPSKASRCNKKIINRVLVNCQYSVIENHSRLGIKNNPYELQSTVFACGSRINIYLEDDTVVSPDLTKLADWYWGLDLQNVVCLNLLYGNCGAEGHRSDPQEPGAVCVTRNFNSLGYICTCEQWRDHLSRFWYCNRPEIKGWGWDWAVLKEVQMRPELCVLQPALARANHIGRLNGTHCPVSLHDAVYAPILINDNPETGLYTLIQEQLHEGHGPVHTHPETAAGRALTCAARSLIKNFFALVRKAQ
jgi:hypothetical protein